MAPGSGQESGGNRIFSGDLIFLEDSRKALRKREYVIGRAAGR
jgi:hypothetical protein